MKFMIILLPDGATFSKELPDIRAWTINYISAFMLDVGIYTSPKINEFNYTTLEITAWISKDISLFYVDVITYPCNYINGGLALC